MKTGLNIRRGLLLSILLLAAFSYRVSAQEQEVVQDSAGVETTTLSIEEISVETERLGGRIKDLKNMLRPSAVLKDVDSLIVKIKAEMAGRKDSIMSSFDSLDARQLKVSQAEWLSYRDNLKKQKEILEDRSSEVRKVSDEVVEELAKWEMTRKRFDEISQSVEVKNNIDTVILNLNEILNLSTVRMDSIFLVQKGLTDIILNVDEILAEMEMVRAQMQSDYFRINSPPLWNAPIRSTDSQEKEHLLSEALAHEKEDLILFFKIHEVVAVFQMLFLLLLLFILLILRKKWFKKGDIVHEEAGEQAKNVFGSPFASTLVVGILVSAFFYNARIPVFEDILVFIVLAATVVLLPKLTVLKFRPPLLLMLVAFLIDWVSVYFADDGFYQRLFHILVGIVLVVALYLSRKVMLSYPDKFKSFSSLFLKLIPVFYFLIGLSIVANVIGMTGLGVILGNGTLNSVVLGLVVILAVKIVTSILIVFLDSQKSHSMESVSVLIEVTHKRLQPVLIGLGFIVWIVLTLMSFDVYDNLVHWLSSSFQIKWEIGMLSISLGEVLSFLAIFIVTLVLAKLVSAIFQDAWMVKVLPRGVAPAISLIMRIVLISLGLYLALASAGIELGKLGFMLGALGVGIGFGLQNVVLNFIAGLILAFERPINLGDTIEIDQEKGVVTNIGIRSSNIKTYSGSEAIIPNGDLISKKVINWTLSNRDRRSKVMMRTAPNADPNEIIELFNSIAASDERVFEAPAPKTYFKGFTMDGNLEFTLLYWTTFSDTFKTDSAIALKIFAELKERGVQAPIPVRRIIKE